MLSHPRYIIRVPTLYLYSSSYFYLYTKRSPYYSYSLSPNNHFIQYSPLARAPNMSQLFDKLYSTVSSVSSAFSLNLNHATLSGAVDIVCQHRDNTYRSSPFHVRFGKLQLLKSREKVVSIVVNDQPVPFKMKLGPAGEAFFVLPVEGEEFDVGEEYITSPISSPLMSPSTVRSPVFSSMPSSQSQSDAEHDSVIDNVAAAGAAAVAGATTLMSEAILPVFDLNGTNSHVPHSIDTVEATKNDDIKESSVAQAVSAKPDNTSHAIDIESESLPLPINLSENSEILELHDDKQSAEAPKTSPTAHRATRRSNSESYINGRPSEPLSIPNNQRLRASSSASQAQSPSHPSFLSPLSPSAPLTPLTPRSRSDSNAATTPWKWSWGGLPTKSKNENTISNDESIKKDELQALIDLPPGLIRDLQLELKDPQNPQQSSNDAEQIEILSEEAAAARSNSNPRPTDVQSDARDTTNPSLVDGNESRWSVRSIFNSIFYKPQTSAPSTPPTNSRAEAKFKNINPIDLSEAHIPAPWLQTDVNSHVSKTHDLPHTHSKISSFNSLDSISQQSSNILPTPTSANPTLSSSDLSQLGLQNDGSMAATSSDHLDIALSDTNRSVSVPNFFIEKDQVHPPYESILSPQTSFLDSTSFSNNDLRTENPTSSSCTSPIPPEYSSDSSLQLSLCAHLLGEDMEANEEVFMSQLVSYEQLCAQPELVYHPSLVVLYQSRLYPNRIALPLIISHLAFHKPLQVDFNSLKRLSAAIPSSAVPSAELADVSATNSASSTISHPSISPSKSKSWRDWFRSKKPPPIDTINSNPNSSNGHAERPPGSAKLTDEHSKLNTRQNSSVPNSPNPELTLQSSPGRATTVNSSTSLHSPSTAASSTYEYDSKTRFYKSLRPTSEMLKGMNLKPGRNSISFTVFSKLQGEQTVSAWIWLWPYDCKIIISDIDGTITKSDLLGHFMPLVGRDWSHIGVTKLFSAIAANGYHFLYLTSRAIGQANLTRAYIHSLRQGETSLPPGPVIMSPDRLMQSFKREVIDRKPQEFKIAALRDVRALFADADGNLNHNCFYAGFGNRITDFIAYKAVGVPLSKIFLINPYGNISHVNNAYIKSYPELSSLVDSMFPATDARGTSVEAEYNEFNFWRNEIPVLEEDEDNSDDEHHPNLYVRK